MTKKDEKFGEHNCCCDELYGGSCCSLEYAFKTIENRREYLKKCLEPTVKKADELANATATDSVRLQGTTEPSPKIHPYTDTITVKDEDELNRVIKEALYKGFDAKVTRGVNSRYTISLSRCKNLFEGDDSDKNDKPINDEKAINVNDMVLVDGDDTKESHSGVNIVDILKKYVTLSLDEDGNSLVICKNYADEEEEKQPCIVIDNISDEDVELLHTELGSNDNTEADKKDTKDKETIEDAYEDDDEKEDEDDDLKTEESLSTRDDEDEGEEDSHAVVNKDVNISLDKLESFRPAGGARDTWNLIVEHNKVNDLANILSDFSQGNKMTTTDLNDLLWLERDWVLESLGI